MHSRGQEYCCMDDLVTREHLPNTIFVPKVFMTVMQGCLRYWRTLGKHCLHSLNDSSAAENYFSSDTSLL